MYQYLYLYLSTFIIHGMYFTCTSLFLKVLVLVLKYFYMYLAPCLVIICLLSHCVIKIELRLFTAMMYMYDDYFYFLVFLFLGISQFYKIKRNSKLWFKHIHESFVDRCTINQDINQEQSELY